MAKLDGIKVVNENMVEYNGFVYELVTGGAKAADVIKASEQELDVTEGAFYLVTEIDDDNDIVFKDDVNHSNYFMQGEHTVFRKSHAITNDELTDAEGVVKIELPDGTKLEGTPSDLEKITRSMQKMLTEQESSEEAIKVEEASESVSERLQVGDYAKVLNGGVWHPLQVGDIVEIIKDDHDHQPFKGKRVVDGETSWFEESQLVKATDEEVLEAKQSLLKEDDFARVIGVEHTKRGGFHDKDNEDVGGGHSFENGTIVELKKPYIKKDETEDAFKAYYLDGSDWWWVHRKDLEPLTKEEAEHIAREAEEEKKAKAERAKWATIGRKVGEIKKGDIVRTTSHCGSVNPVGTVGVAHKDGTVCSCSTLALKGDTSNWSSVELIVPVEQRFDTVG
ncbi:hypothetical protein COF41_25760 [Bacillus toyonensis]|uniref:hypothetical protein n=1 Tax=Bacillus toyonensis TaxID=155322 RepID=UPI000BFE9A8D|nr:hypothetical protein [Bacillus toyonensis]MED2615456.1 hypothetical protein [Bacillus toyonensis]PHE12668.1 hypothetical protein COF41_25760 [Bacillus toyonensis]